jgi:hypothetical protein
VRPGFFDAHLYWGDEAPRAVWASVSVYIAADWPGRLTTDRHHEFPTDAEEPPGRRERTLTSDSNAPNNRIGGRSPAPSPKLPTSSQAESGVQLADLCSTNPCAPAVGSGVNRPLHPVLNSSCTHLTFFCFWPASIFCAERVLLLPQVWESRGTKP